MITASNEHKTVSNDSKEPISPRSSLSDVSQNTSPFTEVKNSFYGPNTSRNDKLEIDEASSKDPSTVRIVSKHHQKITKNYEPDSPNAPKRKNIKLNDPAFLNSTVMPPILKPPSEPDLHQNDSLTSQMSTEKFNLHLNYFRCVWFRHNTNFT